MARRQRTCGDNAGIFDRDEVLIDVPSSQDDEPSFHNNGRCGGYERHTGAIVGTLTAGRVISHR